jgi:hypothetical protein
MLPNTVGGRSHGDQLNSSRACVDYGGFRGVGLPGRHRGGFRGVGLPGRHYGGFREVGLPGRHRPAGGCARPARPRRVWPRLQRSLGGRRQADAERVRPGEQAAGRRHGQRALVGRAGGRRRARDRGLAGRRVGGGWDVDRRATREAVEAPGGTVLAHRASAPRQGSSRGQPVKCVLSRPPMASVRRHRHRAAAHGVAARHATKLPLQRALPAST